MERIDVGSRGLPVLKHRTEGQSTIVLASRLCLILLGILAFLPTTLFAANFSTWVAYLSEKSETIRSTAINQITISGDARAVPVLSEHFGKEPEPRLRIQIVQALSQLGGSAATDAIVRAFQDTSQAVRIQAMKTGFSSKNERLVKPAITLLRVEGAEFPPAAIAWLGEIRVVAAVPTHS